jgi:hypothetical protein
VDIPAKQREFEELKAKVEALEDELLEAEAGARFQPAGFYGAYYATTGFLLGIFGAAAALLVNVIGAPAAGKHPLELIRVYLTFPLGEEALRLTDATRNVPAIDDGMILTFGCFLYLATGMILGVPFQLALSRIAGDGGLAKRLWVATVLSLAIWGIAFYGILSWLQPALFGGRWITDPHLLPPWVAAGTHLVFGWTMALVYPFGQFHTYHRVTEQS